MSILLVENDKYVPTILINLRLHTKEDITSCVFLDKTFSYYKDLFINFDEVEDEDEDEYIDFNLFQLNSIELEGNYIGTIKNFRKHTSSNILPVFYLSSEFYKDAHLYKSINNYLKTPLDYFHSNFREFFTRIHLNVTGIFTKDLIVMKRDIYTSILAYRVLDKTKNEFKWVTHNLISSRLKKLILGKTIKSTETNTLIDLVNSNENTFINELLKKQNSNSKFEFNYDDFTKKIIPFNINECFFIAF